MQPLRQFVHARPRLLVAIAVGIATGLLLPGERAPLTRALLGWNVTAWLYLVLAALLMVRSDQRHLRLFAAQEDRSAASILGIMSIGSLASLAAIVLELSATRQLAEGERLLRYGLTGATVLGSWLLLNVLFTFHYARAFYRSPSGARALRFPDGEPAPDYWDFLYFSFTIAVAAQTSDVSVMTRPLRKTVLVQSVLSFLFNAAIIGLSINIAAGLVGS